MLPAFVFAVLSLNVAADCREGTCYWQTANVWPVDERSDELCFGAEGGVSMGDAQSDGSPFGDLAAEYVAARQNQACSAWDGMTAPIAYGLTSYFDPNATAGVVIDANGRVQSLVDLSGNGRHLSQSTASARPSLSMSDGVRALQFNGSQWLASTAGVQQFVSANAWTIVVEVLPTSTPNRTQMSAPWATNGIIGGFSALDVGVALRNNTILQRIEASAWHVGAAGGWDPSQAHASGPAVGASSIITAQFANNDQVMVQVDDLPPVRHGNTVSNHEASGALSVGRAYAAGTGYLRGRVGRILTYGRTLTPAELEATRAFLRGTGVAPAAHAAQRLLADCEIDLTELSDAVALEELLRSYNEGGASGGQCVVTTCGDGVLEGDEECDDGSTSPGDGCDAGCIAEYCGDGVMNGQPNDAGVDECDDGNLLGGDGCSEKCRREATAALVALSDADDIVRVDLASGALSAVHDTLTGVIEGVDVVPSLAQVFWTNRVLGRIFRANIDGTNAEALIYTPAPYDLEVDEINGFIYWTSFDDNSAVRRSNLDGTSVSTLVSGSRALSGIALDHETGEIYFGVRERVPLVPEIRRMNADGSGLETFLQLGATGSPTDLEIDQTSRLLYWTTTKQTIERISLTGSGRQVWLTFGSPAFLRSLKADPASSRMYWTDSDPGVLRRANLDGTGLENVAFISGKPLGFGLVR